MAPLLLVAGAAAAELPTLARDPRSGLYTITYRDESGAKRQVEFQGVDQVVPELSISLSGSGPFVYRYQVANGADAKQAIWSLNLACDKNSSSVPGARPVRVWDSVRAGLPGPQVHYCRVRLTDLKRRIPEVTPGTRDAGVVALQSAWLPGIRQAEAIGSTEMTTFPGFRDETPESIADLYQSTQSPLKFWTVSPKYAPDVFSNPVQAVAALRDDLTKACSLGWMPPDGICTGLRAKLELAQAAVSSGDPASAAQRLEAYASELQARSGGHVPEIFANAMAFDVTYALQALK
jgi:hypothetical protein